jgi:hypothetical protein
MAISTEGRWAQLLSIDNCHYINADSQMITDCNLLGLLQKVSKYASI